MHNPSSRRALLRTLAAAPLALGPELVAADNRDADLIALAQETQRFAKEDHSATIRLSELEDTCDSIMWPKRPMRPGTNIADSDSAYLKDVLATAGPEWEQEAPHDVAAFRARIAAREAWEAECGALHESLGIDQAREHSDFVWLRLFDELIPALAETRAHSLAGLAAKASALLAFTPDTFKDERTHDLLVSLFTDCERVGGARV